MKQVTIEKHIKNSYFKKVQAPVGVKANLKAWMELSRILCKQICLNALPFKWYNEKQNKNVFQEVLNAKDCCSGSKRNT